MHALLLVTINRSHARTSRTARKLVFTMLYRMPELVHEYDGKHSALADWLVIGGRFSGLLSQNRTTSWPKAVYESLTGTRDVRQNLGYEDDALLVDEELYELHLRSFAGESLHYNKKEHYLAFLDLDQDEVAPAFVGRKWLVVVDLHS